VKVSSCLAEVGWGIGSEYFLEVGRDSSADSHEGQYQCLESNASDYREPVEVTEEGFTWENLDKLNTRRAAAFWMRCKGLITQGVQPGEELQESRQVMTSAWTKICAASRVRKGRILWMQPSFQTNVYIYMYILR